MAELLPALEDAAGMAADLARPGSLHVATDEHEAGLFRSYVAAAQALGLPATWLDAAATRAAEPNLAPELAGAAHLTEAYSVYAPRFVQMLSRAAAARGARVREGVTATAVSHRGGRVVEVDTTEGPIAPGQALLAPGAWSAVLAGWLGLRLPIGPQRGQILALRSAGRAVRHIVHAGDGYLVPKLNGTTVVGATRELAGFDARVTADGLAFLTGLARRIMPALGDATFVHAWVGLRPLMLDGALPVIGPLPGVANAFVAAGHGAVGMTLSLGTGRLLADMILGRRGPDPAFDPARYAPP
jgi:glycine oxidase